ncbi:MAG: type II toxin-antitoxin system PemK/MazF family toxin [Bacteroidetes bacterium]|nr:type II toxin-antitoxin system PemK/MazF family toxin [Bacteroidota bacterium]
MEKGDIILIEFPFTDFTGNKKRPALVLVTGERDITIAFISTQLNWKEGTDIVLKPSKYNGLKKESLIRLSKLVTLDKELALGRLGRIENEMVKQVNKNLIRLFKLDE